MYFSLIEYQHVTMAQGHVFRVFFLSFFTSSIKNKLKILINIGLNYYQTLAPGNKPKNKTL